MRPVGVLVSVLFVAGSLHKLHARPVCIQFVRYDARQRRPASTSHLRAVRNDVRGSIRINGEINVWLKRRFGERIRGSSVRSRGKQLLWHQANAQNKRSRAEHAFEESAPAARQLAILMRNIVDANHAPSLWPWKKIGAKPRMVMLHPTANSFSCKCRDPRRRGCGVMRFRAFEKCYIAISARTVQSEILRNNDSCPQTS